MRGKPVKKTMILAVLCALGVLAGCASGNKVQLKDADLVAQYQKDLLKSKACVTDADCAAVSKGCCLCDGQEAVNKKYEAKLAKQREKACGVGPCTLQMCYTDIDVACVNKVCTGTLKPMRGFAIQ